MRGLRCTSNDMSCQVGNHGLEHQLVGVHGTPSAKLAKYAKDLVVRIRFLSLVWP